MRMRPNFDINWLRLWDVARDYGIQGTRSLESALRTITIPIFGDDFSCHICGHKYSKGHSPVQHVTESHLNCALDHLLELLKNPCEETFTITAALKSFHHHQLIHDSTHHYHKPAGHLTLLLDLHIPYELLLLLLLQLGLFVCLLSHISPLGRLLVLKMNHVFSRQRRSKNLQGFL